MSNQRFSRTVPAGPEPGAAFRRPALEPVFTWRAARRRAIAGPRRGCRQRQERRGPRGRLPAGPWRGRPAGLGGGTRDGSESPWGERGTATRGRGTSRFGTGVRDIRDDLRERLRRNGVSGDWDEPDGPGPTRAGPAEAAVTGTGRMARAAVSRAARAAGGGTGAGRRLTSGRGRVRRVHHRDLRRSGVRLLQDADPQPAGSVNYQASKVYYSDGKTEWARSAPPTGGPPSTRSP